MKNVIYYFTGTGNSLAIAKKIAAALGECELVPIASLAAVPKIAPAADRVGIVCPVYFLGLPLRVAEFAKRFDRSSAGYTFAVVTYGGSGSEPTLRQLDAAIRTQNGRGLDAGFSVKMPGNYILMYDTLSKERCNEVLASAQQQLAGIVSAIGKSEHNTLPRSLAGSLLHAIAYPWFVSHARTKSREFTVSDACTSCGTCAAICPADNIELVEGRPVWKDRCEVCLGCIQLCPAQAIEAGPKTAQRSRYHNPEIALAELKLSKK
jgi:MinD superfamily P-loop ATPase containing an inserted ferredoxin domain